MFLESLARLAEIVSEYEERGEFLISEDYHKQTKELIELQTKFLITELEFKKTDPGPFDFGFGDLTITLFSPDQTDIQEWAAIARYKDWQKNYRFNSIMGLIKILSLIIKDTEYDSSDKSKTSGDQQTR